MFCSYFGEEKYTKRGSFDAASSGARKRDEKFAAGSYSGFRLKNEF